MFDWLNEWMLECVIDCEWWREISNESKSVEDRCENKSCIDQPKNDCPFFGVWVVQQARIVIDKLVANCEKGRKLSLLGICFH